MTDFDSVSHWLDLLKQGNQHAAQCLWQRYYDALIRMARQKLAGANRRMADEEDVVLSGFESLCCGAAEGRFPQLADRNDLWKLLVVITARKAIAHKRRDRRLKRGGGQVRGESVFVSPEGEAGAGLVQVIGHEPSPEFMAQIAEECDLRLAALDDELRQLALWKLEGYTNAEIGQRLGRSERSIERKLHRIRLKWSDALDADLSMER